MNVNEKLIYENERGQSIEFSIVSPFFAQKIDGLDGLKNTIYTNKNMGQDGSTYISSTLESRNILVEGAIKKDKEQNRLKLLSILNPKIGGRITYIDGNVKKFIKCKVEKAPIISKELLPKFLISFLCPNPFWYDLEFKKDVALWQGDFEFPLEIDTSGIVLGHREQSLIVNLVNNSDLECPLRVEFRALATVKNPSLFNLNTREYIKINKTMCSGEKIIVSTGFGEKKVLQELNGIESNAFNYFDLNGTFMQLDIGDNLFRFDAEENIDNLEMSIYFTPQYVGV